MALDGVVSQSHIPATLPPGKRTSTHFTGGWVVPRASLDGCRKWCPNGIQFPDRPTCSKWLYQLRYFSLAYLSWL